MTRRKPDDAVLLAIGRRIAAAREARGLTQEQLAAQAGTGTQNLSKLERGKQYPAEVLGGICDVLGVSSDWILFGRSSRTPHGAAGMALRLAREIQNCSVARLATALAVDLEQVERWEVGVEVPDAPTMGRIGAVLGVSPEQIFPDPGSSTYRQDVGDDVTNEELRMLLDEAGVVDGTERFVFARMASIWQVTTDQAQAMLAASGRVKAAGRAKSGTHRPLKSTR